MGPKRELVEVYEDTKSKCLAGKYGKHKAGACILYTEDHPSILSLQFEPRYDTTEISVINKDVLLVAEDLFSFSKKNVLVLNLASNWKPGGGVRNGAMAQEEELFRRTNYFLNLNDKYYPLNGNVIYNSNVLVVKDEYYRDKERIFPVSMLAVAALKDPELKNGKYSGTDFAYMVYIIDMIFKVAYLNEHDVLVLGALGCGAYNNPPKEVIKIFNMFIKKYWKCFSKIVFAVYSKRDYNYDIFKEGIITSE